ncbi:hypothetical protein ACTL6P_21240 [Endozoicomonas acroporae]|uniref:hypothetical protein n=1 Tax=Endozoicomonas acroporae TaxID=1701104 RepID=UPI000C790DFE|nr:hypothetical protein [Endozoicomonas acroporae]
MDERTFMDTEQTLENITATNSISALRSLCQFLRDKWVYFYVIDDGSFVDGEGIEELVFTKKRPVNIPSVYVNDLHNAVLYIHKSTAIDRIQPEYRIGQMKGDKAYKMFLGVKSITGMIIQGQDAWVSFPVSYLEELQPAEA